MISYKITPTVYFIYLFVYFKKVVSYLSLKFARLRVQRTSKQTKIASGPNCYLIKTIKTVRTSRTLDIATHNTKSVVSITRLITSSSDVVVKFAVPPCANVNKTKPDISRHGHASDESVIGGSLEYQLIAPPPHQRRDL